MFIDLMFSGVWRDANHYLTTCGNVTKDSLHGWGNCIQSVPSPLLSFSSSSTPSWLFSLLETITIKLLALNPSYIYFTFQGAKTREPDKQWIIRSLSFVLLLQLENLKLKQTKFFHLFNQKCRYRWPFLWIISKLAIFPNLLFC